RTGLALLYAGLSLGLGLAALFGAMALVRTL
ncbi:protein CrcB, partial [Achromobacter xylosoxidans]